RPCLATGLLGVPDDEDDRIGILSEPYGLLDALGVLCGIRELNFVGPPIVALGDASAFGMHDLDRAADLRADPFEDADRAPRLAGIPAEPGDRRVRADHG